MAANEGNVIMASNVVLRYLVVHAVTSLDNHVNDVICCFKV